MTESLYEKGAGAQYASIEHFESECYVKHLSADAPVYFQNCKYRTVILKSSLTSSSARKIYYSKYKQENHIRLEKAQSAPRVAGKSADW